MDMIHYQSIFYVTSFVANEVLKINSFKTLKKKNQRFSSHDSMRKIEKQSHPKVRNLLEWKVNIIKHPLLFKQHFLSILKS